MSRRRAPPADADRAEEVVAGLVAAFDGLEDIAGTRERILTAQAEAKRLRARATRLASAGGALDVDPADPDLTLAERRGIVQRTISRALVARSAPGMRGAGRIAVTPFDE
jgi:hypothetical protein